MRGHVSMAESEQSADSPEGTGPATDPVATTLALGGASRTKADAFLDNQNSLIDIQKHHLRAQFKHLGLRIWGERMSVLLRVATAFMGLAVAAALAFMVWDAAHDEGLVVEAFSVPPDMAARGLTGQAVATQMLDNLSSLLAQTNSSRALNSYSNNWGDDLKVEIPETGVSIGEFNRYLHQVLGRQTHISGEVVRSAAGITVIARSGAEAGERFAGTEADFDALMQKAAEAVYARTQPFRYGVYLQNQRKLAEAEAVFRTLTNSASASERAWAYVGVFNAASNSGRLDEARDAAAASVAANPDNAWGWSKVAAVAGGLGHGEDALAAFRKELQALNGPGAKELQPSGIPSLRQVANIRIDNYLGDYTASKNEFLTLFPVLGRSADAESQIQANASVPGIPLGNAANVALRFADNQIAMHELAGARKTLAQAPDFISAFARRGEQNLSASAAQIFRGGELELALAQDDWPRVLQIAPVAEIAAAKPAISYLSYNYPVVSLWPDLAYGYARSGNFAAAHALIDRTPADCDPCLSVRGMIDAAEKNYGGADYWFDLAVKAAPSIPFAYAEWGRMLMQRGDFSGAIAQFKLANQKGPHFADPLEMWGEVLMAQNRSDLALAKFTEAEKYAPNWGRLHLKWGEALSWLGKTSDAQKQFARAGELDLTAAEKTELAKVNHG